VTGAGGGSVEIPAVRPSAEVDGLTVVRPFVWTAWKSAMWKVSPSHSEARRAAGEGPQHPSRYAHPSRNSRSNPLDSYASLITEGLLGIATWISIELRRQKLENEDEIPGREEKAIRRSSSERRSDDELNSITEQASAFWMTSERDTAHSVKFMVDEEAYRHLNSRWEPRYM